MKKIIFILFVSLKAISQNADSIISTNTLSKTNALEIVSWKFRSGDDHKWSVPEYNDSDWDTSNCDLSANKISETITENIIWFRKTITIDSTLQSLPLFLQVYHNGASQVFIDGKLSANFGTVSSISSDEKVFNPVHSPMTICFREKGKHVLAVRYSNHNGKFFRKLFKFPIKGFSMDIGLVNSTYFENINKYGVFSVGFLLIFGALFTLGLLHLLIFLYYREQKSNLNYSLFTFSFAFFVLMFELNAHSSNPFVTLFTGYYRWRFLAIIFIFLLRMVYSIIFEETPKKLKRITNILSLIIFSMLFFMPFLKEVIVYSIIVLTITGVCSTIGVLISSAQKQKHEGIKIVGGGFKFFLYFSGTFFILTNFHVFSFDPDSWKGFLVFCFLAIGILSIPVTMSTYLALSFARTTKQLKIKLKQVETLSAKTIEQEREKKNLIERQKEELEIQVKIRTAEVVEQKHVIETKQKEILDSIKYASRIQRALITSELYIKRKLNELSNKD